MRLFAIKLIILTSVSFSGAVFGDDMNERSAELQVLDSRESGVRALKILKPLENLFAREVGAPEPVSSLFQRIQRSLIGHQSREIPSWKHESARRVNTREM